MNEDLDKNQQRPIVTSVGNAWVICNSKSRPGYKYYFNTLSGQAVWNLSPDEVSSDVLYTRNDDTKPKVFVSFIVNNFTTTKLLYLGKL